MFLNPEQQLAVQTIFGPVRIIAGAGTGKTRVIIERTINLINQKTAAAPKILILTFTNKAAHEIKNRLLEREIFAVNVMTFHSLSARLLRKCWKSDFTINDDNDPETLDFDKLIQKLLEIFNDPEILKLCQKMFDFIMVDEYQDVNNDQIEIVKKLCALHKNVCVVGDPDQTIYSWRGANPKSMQEFMKIYNDAVSINLKINYRNPVKILKGAESLISNNKDRLPKDLISITEITKRFLHSPDRTSGSVEMTNVIPLIQPGSEGMTDGVHLWTANDFYEETEMLMHLLEKYLGSHSLMSDADNLDSGKEEQKFSFSDIAIIYRTQDQGKVLAKKLEKRGYPFIKSSPECFWESPEIKKFCAEMEKILEWTTNGKILDSSFSNCINEHVNSFIETEKPTDLKQQYLKSLTGIAAMFDDLPLNEALQQFLDERKITTAADNLLNIDAINLLTFHAAKGLEFPIVLIMGLEEEKMPYKKSIPDPYLLSEERRLMYVGMTRAINELHLFTNKKVGTPSRFIKEIGGYHLSTLPQKRLHRLNLRKQKNAQMSLF